MMGLCRIAFRGIEFYRRTYMALAGSIALACAVLVGAVTVGQSVRWTLHKHLREQLGQVRWAIGPGERFFAIDLAERLQDKVATVAPIIHIPGHVATPDGTARANGINVIGVDRRFFALGPGRPISSIGQDEVWFNPELARRLGVWPSSIVILQVQRPSQIMLQTHIVSRRHRITAIRLKVGGILDEKSFGQFALTSNPGRFNAFVDLTWLGEQIGMPGKANCLLIPQSVGPNQELARHWQLEDVGLQLHLVSGGDWIELTSSRVFIEDHIADIALKEGQGAVGILTYLVNRISNGDRVCPYSFVSAIGGNRPIDILQGWPIDERSIVINQWLAEDINAVVGDQVRLDYYVPEPGGLLSQASRSFIVAGIIPNGGPDYDATLSPQIPGLSDTDNCRDWDPGLPIDLGLIRPKDEVYWQQYRSMPKAFVALDTAIQMWSGSFGSLTSIRWPAKDNDIRSIYAQLRQDLDINSVGLAPRPVWQDLQRAALDGTDLGMLLVGMGSLLIIAALILTGLVFSFHVESRIQQVGVLLSLGLGKDLIRKILLLEGGMIALAGSILGIPLGMCVAYLLITGLKTIWKGAIPSMAIAFHPAPGPAVLGGLLVLLPSLAVIYRSLCYQLRQRPAQLLSDAVAKDHRKGLHWLVIASVGTLVVAVLLAIWSVRVIAKYTAVFFFASGMLLLAGCILLANALLTVGGIVSINRVLTRSFLVLRSMTSRPGRGTATIGVLACGIFIVISVGANRQARMLDPRDPSSGTGGFTLYAQSTIQIPYDLNVTSSHKELGLDDMVGQDVKMVSFRLFEGDQASCLNLARAQRPSLLAVRPEALVGRFSFKKALGNKGWMLLEDDLGPEIIPAIGDYATIVWALGKGLGERIRYIDELGRPFFVQIVGIISDSVLQGSLVISEQAFLRRFPSKAGYHVMLIDPQPQLVAKLMQGLQARLADYGLEVVTAQERLEVFKKVEATYISIFTALGGIGLVLGTVGLAIVVMRNLLERRGELAVMQAVGFTRSDLVNLATWEHLLLLSAGVVIGVCSALLAVGQLLRTTTDLPLWSLSVTILAILICGLICVRLAAIAATSGGIWDTLRNE